MTTILVVEDDDAIRSNIVRLLKLEGFDIVAAPNGALGLQSAREARPDIVISDIGMPEMDGFALLEAIRADARLASTPVMLLTALDDRASMRRGMTAGADDYLAKPFTRVELLEALQALMRRKESRSNGLRSHELAPAQEPLRLRGYRLTRKIGAGGMTDVYLAEREKDALAVVLKVLDARGRRAAEHLSRFIQEYTLLSRIDHPNVVRIYDQGFTDDHAYIAMEYFPQGDLRAELGAGMSLQRVLDVLAQVARALSAIHARGVIHRDLKPENIMRRADDTVALADFGIAKSLLNADNLALSHTKHGDVVGTPYYLSPEQAAGRAVTPLSDLYSLGVMMFEMLAGQRPFQAGTLDLLLAHHLSAPTPQLPATHARLQPILERLMAKAPQDRFADADAFLAELQALPLPRTPAPPR
ncbi:response regulator [Ramlibacter henchirensis]|uniref:Response regulator n=1 Tax=Ramlibacter henchirensis TaxID=204072 RepID=A0A4Z0C393_9BURK|nr:protein kinase [Ramlibacter henchirensis]TFZ05304.1 response regulator [Ramlibacter henchirensis]